MTALTATLVDLLNQFSITGTEAPMQSSIEQRVRGNSNGAQAKIHFRPHKQSLVAFVSPPRVSSDSLVLILGHTDTVPGEIIPARIDGDTVTGLGASDMKSGLAIILELCRADLQDRMTSPVAFVFYAGEEGPSHDNELASVAGAIAELKAAKLALFAEPTDRTIQLGCLGLLNERVIFNGEAAHSARLRNGVNAIQRAGKFLTALDGSMPKIVQVGPVEYAEVASVTPARGRTASNVVPASFELTLNVRLAPGTNPEQRIAELKALVGEQASFEVYDRAPAGRVPVNNALYAHHRAYAAAPEDPKQAYTDVGLLSQLVGLDAVNFGPGLTNQCHAANEYARMPDVECCFAKYVEFLTSTTVA